MSTPAKVVFVVDDDPAMLKSIGLLLTNMGFVTKLYPSAEAFLSAAAVSGASKGCIVLDVQLGGMSGIELGSQLAGCNRGLRTIFITGNDNESARKAAIEQGCVAYLTKPFAAKLLLDAIDQALA